MTLSSIERYRHYLLSDLSLQLVIFTRHTSELIEYFDCRFLLMPMQLPRIFDCLTMNASLPAREVHALYMWTPRFT